MGKSGSGAADSPGFCTVDWLALISSMVSIRCNRRTSSSDSRGSRGRGFLTPRARLVGIAHSSPRSKQLEQG